MAIGTPYTIVSGSQAPSTSTALRVTVSASSAAGDAIVVAASSDTLGETVTGVTDSQGNAYLPLASDYSQSDGITAYAALSSAVLASGTDWIQATFSGSVGSHCLNGRGCSGVATANALDQAVAADAAASTAMSAGTGPLDPVSEWAVVFAVNGNGGGTPTSWTGGFTARNTAHATNNQYQTVADQITTSTAALTAGATVASTKWAMLLVTLQAGTAVLYPLRGPVRAQALPWAGAAVRPPASTGGSRGSAGGMSTRTLVNTFEEGTNTTTVTTGNSGGTGSTAFDATFLGTSAALTFDNTHTAHGGLACKVVTGASVATSFAEWSSSLGTALPQVWLRTYLYFTANPASAFGLARFLTAHGGSQVARLTIKANGTIGFNDGANTQQIVSASTIPLNQWLRIEGYATGSATTGQLSFSIYSPADSQSPIETQTSAAALNTTGTIGAVNFGITGTGLANETYWMDDIGVSSAGALGPVSFTGRPSAGRPARAAGITLPARGRSYGGQRSPVANPGRGPAIRPLRGPARAPIPQTFSRGHRCAASPGAPVANPTVGPKFSPARSPARTRITLPPAGRVASNDGAAVSNPTVPPPFYPRNRALHARRPQRPRGGWTSARKGAPVSNPVSSGNLLLLFP